MEMKLKAKQACFRGLGMSLMLLTTGMMTTGMLQGSVLWSNGSVPTSGGPCEGACGGAPVTIFDNFTAASSGWTMTGFDYSDFFVSTSTGTYTGTKWSIWAGDPLTTGTLVASGSTPLGANANLSITNCNAGPTNCLTQITVSGLSVQLNPGTTYYLGTSTILSSGGVTRALASGNGLPNYEVSNGTNSNVVGSLWTPGSVNTTTSNGGDTAFDIIGTTPEPGTISLMTLAIAGLFLVKNRRSGQKATT